MRRQLIRRATGSHTGLAIRQHLPQLAGFPQQRIDLLLLPHDDLIQLIKQVLCKAGLDLQLCQPVISVGAVSRLARLRMRGV